MRTVEDDRNTPLPSGWLPPQAPSAHAPSPPPAPRPAGSWPPEPAKPAEPSTPAAVFAIGLGVASILLLVLSVGVGFFGSLVMSAVALLVATRLRHAIQAGRPGRESQARTAVVLAWVGLGLAVIAGITWIILAASGVTPQDLQDTLERQLERQRSRG
jgi:hypothetical protein